MNDQERIRQARDVANRHGIAFVSEELTSLYNGGPNAPGAIDRAREIATQLEQAGREMLKVLDAE